MKIIRGDDCLFLDRYKDILDGCPEYKFRQDGIFIPLGEAAYLEIGLRKRPYECTSMDEFNSVKSAVIKLKATVAKAMREKRKEQRRQARPFS
jgi:hypothetical protein